MNIEIADDFAVHVDGKPYGFFADVVANHPVVQQKFKLNVESGRDEQVNDAPPATEQLGYCVALAVHLKCLELLALRDRHIEALEHPTAPADEADLIEQLAKERARLILVERRAQEIVEQQLKETDTS